MKKCYIAGAGEFCENVLPETGDYIIAADGGYALLASRGIKPDLVVGDFDSLAEPPDHLNIISSRAEKDDTDMMLAVKQGLEYGCKTFIINGGLGGRLDHTLANIQTLVYIVENNARGILVGADACITAIKNSKITFRPGKRQGGTVSVFCAGDRAEGVTLKGLKYPLENATLTCSYPLGVSNAFTGKSADISVVSGILIIMWEGSPADI